MIKTYYIKNPNTNAVHYFQTESRIIGIVISGTNEYMQQTCSAQMLKIRMPEKWIEKPKKITVKIETE